MAVLGVLVSVAAFVVVEGVMSGFGRDLQSKIIGFSSHLSLQIKAGTSVLDLLEHDLPQRVPSGALAHFLEGEAILRTEDGQTAGIRLRGLDPQHRFFPQGFKAIFEEEEGWKSLPSGSQELPGILLGIELATSLGIVPALQETVELLYPLGEVGPTGEVEPNVRRFRVVGIFKTGYFDYDSKFALLGMEEARRLLGENSTEKIGIYLPDPNLATDLKKSLQILPGVEQVKSWSELNSRLFSALKLERWGMAVVLTLMILLASFNILSLLMMLVFERRKEIAVLRSLGMSEKGISRLFFKAGLWIGGVGGIAGVGIGALLCWALGRAKLRLPSPYYIESLPIDASLPILGIGFCLALFLSLAATYFPAREGRRFTIVEALRFE